MASKVYVSRIVSDQIATGPSASAAVNSIHRTIHGTGVCDSGTGSAVIEVEVSNDDATWINLGTITLVLSGTVAGDGFASVAPWKYMRGNVTTLTGTGAKVNLYVGSAAIE